MLFEGGTLCPIGTLEDSSPLTITETLSSNDEFQKSRSLSNREVIKILNDQDNNSNS